MASRASHNKNNAGVKRILQEAKELATDPSTDYHAAPLEDDIFEWHCTMRGSPGTEYEGGLYHFRIQLPSEYPFRPPSIMMLTPNGRFELNTKICISFTNYHEESWQPAWGVRTAIIALQGFFPLKGEAAVGVGAMECSTAERRRLAALSRNWACSRCEKPNYELLPNPTSAEEKPTREVNTNTSDTSTQSSSDHIAASEKSSVEGTMPTSPVAEPTETSESSLSSTNGPQSQHRLIDERQDSRSRPARPPLLLDGAIAVCFMLLIAILCKRLV